MSAVSKEEVFSFYRGNKSLSQTNFMKRFFEKFPQICVDAGVGKSEKNFYRKIKRLYDCVASLNKNLSVKGNREKKEKLLLETFLGREDTQSTVKSQTEAVRKEGVLDD